jgi:hypothetical protein
MCIVACRKPTERQRLNLQIPYFPENWPSQFGIIKCVSHVLN